MATMPRPLSEREAWERERHEELPQQLAALEAELAATPFTNKVRREMREWQIRRVRLRMAELDRRLASIPATD